MSTSGREATIAAIRPPAGRVSDIRLLGHFQRIVDFDSKVPDDMLQLGVTQQQLHRPALTLGAECQAGMCFVLSEVLAGHGASCQTIEDRVKRVRLR